MDDDTAQIEERKGDEHSASESNNDTNDDDFNKNDDLNCRFYREEWPQKEELVMVEITQVNEEGAYVRLLEYNNQEGLILAASITRKRIRNVRQFLKLGQQDCMQVIQVDKEQAFIDLSKKVIKSEEAVKKKREYDKSKIVHLILRLTAHNLKCKLIKIYEDFGWDLYDVFEDSHPYDALKLCLTEPELVFGKIKVTDVQKEELLKNIKKRLAPQPMKLRTCFNLKCYTIEGVEALKESLIAARRQTADDKFELQFQVIAPPEYKIEVVTLDKNGGIQRLHLALEIVEKEIKERGGLFKLVSEPHRIGSRIGDVDDDETKAHMKDEFEDDDKSSSEEEPEDNEDAIKVDLDSEGDMNDDDMQ